MDLIIWLDNSNGYAASQKQVLIIAEGCEFEALQQPYVVWPMSIHHAHELYAAVQQNLKLLHVDDCT